MKSVQDKRIRVAVLGHCNVGKSALTVRYLTRRYIGEYRSNSDLLYRQTVNVQNNSIHVEIVDVSGETRDCDFPTELVQWADACLVVYSITDNDSFETAKKLLERLSSITSTTETKSGGRSASSNTNNFPLVALLANKSDLEHLRTISENEGSSLAASHKCNFYELSVAENTEEVSKAFETILMQCKNPTTNISSKSFPLISQLSNDSNSITKNVRKFSVTKMLGSLIGKSSQSQQQKQQQPPQQPSSGTVVVFQRSDLYRNKVLQRRHNFMAAVSL